MYLHWIPNPSDTYFLLNYTTTLVLGVFVYCSVRDDVQFVVLTAQVALCSRSTGWLMPHHWPCVPVNLISAGFRGGGSSWLSTLSLPPGNTAPPACKVFAAVTAAAPSDRGHCSRDDRGLLSHSEARRPGTSRGTRSIKAHTLSQSEGKCFSVRTIVALV